MPSISLDGVQISARRHQVLRSVPDTTASVSTVTFIGITLLLKSSWLWHCWSMAPCLSEPFTGSAVPLIDVLMVYLACCIVGDRWSARCLVKTLLLFCPPAANLSSHFKPYCPNGRTEVRSTQASHIIIVWSQFNGVLIERLCVCRQGTPFMCFLFSKCWWFFLYTLPFPPHQVLHIWWVCQKRETVCLPSSPTSVPSDQLVFFLFSLIALYVLQ